MQTCGKCSFENYDGANYCQQCGSQLVQPAKYNNLYSTCGAIARICNPGYFLAPLLGLQIDKARDKRRSKASAIVPVIPLKDGSWYCPDCGEYNRKNQLICLGCGRDL